MKLTIAVLVGSASLLACGGPSNRGTPPGGCPPAEAVAFAQWSPGGAHAGAPAEDAWLVRLGYRDVPGEHGDDEVPAPPTEPVLAPGPLPGYDVAKLGLGPLPPTVWLLRAGLPPCAAQVTGHVVERFEDGPISHAISAVLAGCPGPTDDSYAVGWISFAGGEPKDCRVELPAEVSRRTGVESEDGKYTIDPSGESVVPAPWQVAMPQEPCDNCAQLWSIETVAGDPAISAVIVTDVVLPIDPEGGACNLETHTHFGIYATPKDGAPVPIPLEDVSLYGALVDTRGARVVLGAGVDHWAVADVAADGTPGASRTVQFFLKHEEDSLWHSMAPYCGP